MEDKIKISVEGTGGEGVDNTDLGMIDTNGDRLPVVYNKLFQKESAAWS
jgi:hypothetical protein